MSVCDPASDINLLPEYNVAFICIGNRTIDSMASWMRLGDSDLLSRFVRNDENPDYVIATDKCLFHLESCRILKHYISTRKDAVFIFYTYECLEPDMNIFDYAFTWNHDLVCGDRIGYNFPYTYNFRDKAVIKNDITRTEAAEILKNNPRFCCFIHSHSNEPRDTFFQLLSQYKHVDSLGAHLNNTGTKSTLENKNWYDLSINMKQGYKFCISMENAAYRGYTTEKIVSSLQAHTVPIYWGDPAVSDYINPKAFINCNDYSSFDEVIERVREIDNDDELWLDMVTQPFQTEEQELRTLQAASEYEKFLRSIFSQDLKNARRRPSGMWPTRYRNGITGMIGMLPSARSIIVRLLKKIFRSMIPQKFHSAIKQTVKNFFNYEAV